ncbi:hypothetical protein BDA96_10G343500 [Sorghum bicolor]|uniref:Uncharacterized protein n=2 Tax=Sorghum bicolor TaxID=4558 RepID=A0A921Q8T3_SORBI|nr:uncharacterized protein LOC110430953 isoform X2 [Sorghum bicolor]KAG0516225.1 hypothetical protein BDA96_10G343500 [Sorghum bicolor]KXG20891.1 hypothetical protein SORBI_3010G266700 [Sorghum bicolor]|eukprot:XP_021304901.1 uncharacterized protein LOC110430953 isoform X2 [Sorghum bicolor]
MAPRRQREASAPRQAANAGRRNLTGAAAARLGPRNHSAAAAATGRRPHARNRRSVGDIGNHGEANRRHRRLNRYLSAQPNAAAADENTIAPAETGTILDDLMKAGDVAEAVAMLRREANQLKEIHEEINRDLQRLAANANRLQNDIEELRSEKAWEEAQVQKLMEELESEKAQKEAEVQKVMEENVRLSAMLDKKEAQLQAMSEQCKFMALNHN